MLRELSSIAMLDNRQANQAKYSFSFFKAALDDETTLFQCKTVK
jgi:hypothetical protein